MKPKCIAKKWKNIYLLMLRKFDLFCTSFFKSKNFVVLVNEYFRLPACCDCDDPVLFALCSFVCVMLTSRGEQIRFVCNYEVLWNWPLLVWMCAVVHWPMTVWHRCSHWSSQCQVCWECLALPHWWYTAWAQCPSCLVTCTLEGKEACRLLKRAQMVQEGR